MRNIATVTGIRPDFIRMSEVFKKLDSDPTINHYLIHTGQHYDKMLSDVFFKDLEIRKPNLNLKCGKGTHETQVALASVGLTKFSRNNPEFDTFIFLGDSNSVCSALALKKEGKRVVHIEAGMRSHDTRMLEEINRKVCDHCSDILFCYHEDYRTNLYNEGIKNNVHVVGNTIIEPCLKFIPKEEKKQAYILVDIHRPENFNDEKRMINLFKYFMFLSFEFKLPIVFLQFERTIKKIKEYKISSSLVEFIPLCGYKDFVSLQYHAAFMVSDSGTAQEEPALLKTPVIVPRDFTERPQSYQSRCSFQLDLNNINQQNWDDSIKFAKRGFIGDSSWLGDGSASSKIINLL